MSTTNKMVVYLEHALGLYGSKLDQALVKILLEDIQKVAQKCFTLKNLGNVLETNMATKKRKKELEDLNISLTLFNIGC